jgi:tetratricopeptide (TPR) repeat protein
LTVCVGQLVQAVAIGPPLPAHVLAEALGRLEDTRPILRKGEPVPALEVEILQLLWEYRERVPGLPSLSTLAEAFEQATAAAEGMGDVELAIRALAARAGCLRDNPDSDPQDLVNSLQRRAQLLEAAGRPEEAIEAMEEAAALASAEEEAFVQHNLGRRLAAAGRSRQALEASSRAVELLARQFLGDGEKVPAAIMASLIISLGKRAEECDEADLQVTPLLVGTVQAMLDHVGTQPAEEVDRPVFAAYAVVAAADRQNESQAARELYEAIVRLAGRRPGEESVETARVVLGSSLAWREIRRGDLAAARALHAEVAAAAREMPVGRLVAEQGKSAADLISAYLEAGDVSAARELATADREALLSAPYLEMRRADVGDDRAAFTAAVEELAG